MTKLEEETVRAFMNSRCRERWLLSLDDPKRRRQVTRRLADDKEFKSNRVTEIQRSVHTAGGVFNELRRRGAPEYCHIVSEDPNMDGSGMLLLSALNLVIGSGQGTLLICIAGRLSYHESETGHGVILEWSHT